MLKDLRMIWKSTLPQRVDTNLKSWKICILPDDIRKLGLLMFSVGI